MRMTTTAATPKASPAAPNPAEPFLSDVKTLRERAKQHIDEGAVTPSYGGDV
jgi:hypothetical protein